MSKHGHADSRIIGGYQASDETPTQARIRRLQSALVLASSGGILTPGYAALHERPIEVGSYDIDGFDDGLGDLIGDDGMGDMGDLVGALMGTEVGRKLLKRRRQAAQIKSLRRQLTAPQEAAQAKAAMLAAQNQAAMASGDAGTAGHYVADGGQREFYLPFQTNISVAAAIGSGGTLSVTVQRPMMVKRIIVDALDATTLADVLPTLGVTSILGGVAPLFNAQGIAPARSFAFNAVGNHLKSEVLRVGTVMTMVFSRMVTGANACNVSGYVIGVSAQN